LSKTYDDLRRAEQLVHGGTIVSSGLHIKGEISGSEDVLVEGSVDGTFELPSGLLTVRLNGKMKANISAQAIVIHGEVEGNIAARDRIEIKKDGSVVGDVKTPRLIIEDGAAFNGAVEAA
jgi:cytoskeletal protein CcmA (bactofilin family)